MADDIKFEGRLWAIVGTGQKQYIGKVMHANEFSHKAAEDGITPRCMCECPPYIELCPCYELLSITQMLQLPNGSAVPKREVLFMPVDACKRDVTKRFRPTDITYAEDIHENDRTEYIQRLRDLRAQLDEARGQDIGLAKPPRNFNPMNPQGGGPFGRS
jgi:hypothetical protein